MQNYNGLKRLTLPTPSPTFEAFSTISVDTCIYSLCFVSVANTLLTRVYRLSSQFTAQINTNNTLTLIISKVNLFCRWDQKMYINYQTDLYKSHIYYTKVRHRGTNRSTLKPTIKLC